MNYPSTLGRGPTLRSLRLFFIKNVNVQEIACSSRDLSQTLATLKLALSRSQGTISTTAATVLAKFVAQTLDQDIAASLTPAQSKAVLWIDEKLQALTDADDWLATIQVMIALYRTAPISEDLIESFLYWL